LSRSAAAPAGVKGSTILTSSGRYFDIMRPTVDMVVEIDIARGLANTCRFAGHTREFYSVAQHCVLVSKLVPREFALAGLLHDAAEAYVGDVVSPLKQYLPNFKTIEQRIERVIARKFGLSFPWPKDVKYADVRALRFERQHLMHPCGDWNLERYEAVEGELVPLLPNDAAQAWSYRFMELRGAR
jgi:hypothetical protein